MFLNGFPISVSAESLFFIAGPDPAAALEYTGESSSRHRETREGKQSSSHCLKAVPSINMQVCWVTLPFTCFMVLLLRVRTLQKNQSSASPRGSLSFSLSCLHVLDFMIYYLLSNFCGTGDWTQALCTVLYPSLLKFLRQGLAKLLSGFELPIFLLWVSRVLEWPACTTRHGCCPSFSVQ